PQKQKSGGHQQRRRFVAHEQKTRGGRIDDEGDRAENHGAGFGRGIDMPLAGNREAERGERNRGRGAEESSERFGTKDIPENGKAADDEPAEKETEKEIGHRAPHLRLRRISGGLLRLADEGPGSSRPLT